VIQALEPGPRIIAFFILTDLADYLDKRRERALKECRQLNGIT